MLTMMMAILMVMMKITTMIKTASITIMSMTIT